MTLTKSCGRCSDGTASTPSRFSTSTSPGTVWPRRAFTRSPNVGGRLLWLSSRRVSFGPNRRIHRVTIQVGWENWMPSASASRYRSPSVSRELGLGGCGRAPSSWSRATFRSTPFTSLEAPTLLQNLVSSTWSLMMWAGFFSTSSSKTPMRRMSRTSGSRS